MGRSLDLRARLRHLGQPDRGTTAARRRTHPGVGAAAPPDGQRGQSGAAEELAASPLLAFVTRLELRGRDLGDAGVAFLAASPHLGGLRELILHHCGIETAGAVALRALLTALTWLNLGANDINDDGLAALARSPQLSGLRNRGLAPTTSAHPRPVP